MSGLNECSLTDTEVRNILANYTWLEGATERAIYAKMRRLAQSIEPEPPRQMSDYLHEKALQESAQVIADTALRVRMLDTARVGELMADRQEPRTR